MKISDQIRVLCARLHISVAELSRRIGCSPQSFSGKMRRESFRVTDLEKIAEVTGTSFLVKFVFPDGEKI